jgi:2-oxoglutarate ferredoxin oxidoreductase subunit gamma
MTEETTWIRLAGLGGQGVVLAGILLGHAAVFDGLYAAGSNSYGAQARGSLCSADIVISRSPIDYPRVELAGILVAMSQEGYDAYATQVLPEGRILHDAMLIPGPAGSRRHFGFDVIAASMEQLKDKQVTNIIWTGILAGMTGLFRRQSLEQAIRTHVPERYIESNLRALQHGIAVGASTWDRP